MNDDKARSIVKTITWRITGSSATFLISYLIVGDFSISSGIAATQLILNTILYYVHERVWNNIRWGRG